MVDLCFLRNWRSEIQPESSTRAKRKFNDSRSLPNGGPRSDDSVAAVPCAAVPCLDAGMASEIDSALSFDKPLVGTHLEGPRTGLVFVSKTALGSQPVLT